MKIKMLTKQDTVKFVDDFKNFALKGNVLDLAIGVIIGGAFGKIVSSLVSDIIMPPIGFLAGGVNFTELKLVLKEAVGEKPAIAINYGNFLQITFDFVIITFSIYLLLKLMLVAKRKVLKKEEIKVLEKVSKQEELLTEIRDALLARK